MRKEVLIAIFIGVSLGLIMTYGIYVARNSMISQPEVSVSPSPAANPTTIVESTLVLSSPIDESLVSQAEISVTGTTVPRSQIVISLHDKDITTNADETGHFSLTVTLSPGGNIIVVTAIDEAGNVTTSERSVILAVDEFLSIDDSSSSAKVSPSPTAKPKTATSSASPKASPATR